MPEPPPPSQWVQRWAHLIPPNGSVLDVACGSGRNLRWLAARGWQLTGVDRDAAALAGLAQLGEVVQADLEAGPWPFTGRQFDGVVVTNYLWRPLLRAIVSSVAEHGVLLYETFAAGNETVGRPGRADFLLQPGELLGWCSQQHWHVVAFEDGFIPQPERFVQRIAAVRKPRAMAGSRPARHRLSP